MFGSRFTFDKCEMGKKIHTSRGKCDFNGDILVGNGKRKITIFKNKNFSGNVNWGTGFVRRNLRKMCPWECICNNTLRCLQAHKQHSSILAFLVSEHITVSHFKERHLQQQREHKYVSLSHVPSIPWISCSGVVSFVGVSLSLSADMITLI